MHVIPNSKFEIGAFRFKGCTELTIKKSIFQYADTGILTLPASAVLKQEGALTESVQTARQFKVGDKVSIELGYDGKLRNEFKGFVKQVNFTTPAEIELEGYSWILRNKKNIKKSWRTTTLKEVLEEVVKGTEIKLHSKIPDLPLKNLVLNNASGTQVLDYLIDLLKGTLTAFFLDDVLYVGLTYMDIAETTVKYKLGWNTINDDDLKHKNKEDVKVNAVFQFKDEDGKKVEEGAGPKDATITRFEKLSAVTDKKHLKEIAEAKLRQESYDGFEGTISTHLQPFCQPGFRAEIESPRYKEKEGTYFATSVETSYGQGGGKRKVEIGIKLI
ncbi:MAG: hypothetical protein H0X62_04820 [Bacteroidetes bacterium]|nr:hypothetical protein [Bacteroidota bacterium]